MKSFKPDCGTVDKLLNLAKNIFAVLFAAKEHIATIQNVPSVTGIWTWARERLRNVNLRRLKRYN